MKDKEEIEENLSINESLRSELKDQDLGTHLCCIYRDEEEQLSALSPFIFLGIKRNEKCLYVVDDRTKKEVIEGFKDLGFDVESFIESGQFEFMTKSESYLKDGYFDPGKMIDLLEECKEKALEEGYSGLRVTGEMTWFFTDVPGVERLMEYEKKLNEFLPEQKIIALCQYNEKKFEPEILVDVIRSHPKVLIYDQLHENSYYMPPQLFSAKMNGEVTLEHYESMKEDIIQRTHLRKKEKKTKKRLEKEKEKAQRYFDIAGVMIVVLNRDNEVEEINQRGCEILGYDKDEIIGKDWYENFVPERLRKDVIEEAGKPLMEGKVEEGKQYENPVLTKDGEERIISWKNTVLRNDEGEITGTLSSGMDITGRIRAEKEKRKVMREKERIMDTVPDIIYKLDEEGRMVEWNERLVEISGYSSEELEDMHALDFFPEDQKEKISKSIENVFQKGSTVVEADFLTRSGERIPYSFKATRIDDEDDETIGLTGVGRDLTERRKAEERFKELFNAIPNPTYFVDDEGVFRQVNESAVELLGFDRDQIIGQHLLEVPFFPQETKEKIIENFKKRLSGDEFSPYRVKAETKNGETHYIEINATVIEEKGEPIGTIGIARDVTKLKKSQERREFLQTLLRQDLRSKNRTMQGFMQLIDEETSLSEKHKGYLKRAIKAGREIDEILELAKKLEEIEESDWSTEKNIVKVLNHVTEDISGLVEEEGVEIEKDYPEEVLKVKGDYSLNTLLSQILVTRTRLSQCQKIKIDIIEQDQEILLKFEDDGKSLPEDIKRLFSGEVYTGDTTGAGGVRYYMLREIAEHNHYDIEVSDSEFGGALMEVKIKEYKNK